MKKSIGYIIVPVSIACLLFINSSPRLPDVMNKDVRNDTEPGFVIMELFTSQGCSSCPPADEILGMYALKNDEYIIPLAFHVDYWNRLGWVDSFSNSIYSQRQRKYAELLNTESVYTPQLIINGQKQMVGSNKSKIEAITNEYLKEKAAVKINITGIHLTKNKIDVNYKVSSLLPNMNINAALVEKNIVTQIKAGENRGVKLTNYNVVRQFKTSQLINAWGSFTLELPVGDTPDNYMVVLSVQDINSGTMMGAVKKNCNNSN